MLVTDQTELNMQIVNANIRKEENEKYTKTKSTFHSLVV